MSYRLSKDYSKKECLEDEKQRDGWEGCPKKEKIIRNLGIDKKTGKGRKNLFKTF